ncbi:polysaccharide lyase family 14 protein [Sphaerobolus stellatus SS14]|uniref:Polysaccharide lyase family 14 protein n=1 Tax=Sphaerobolus stellatus (strain SS14) TaxID=990650 RepID=A0A0C9VMS2_SPHS4|nr:polysaccharide lyase family 14 protein [Sphaerobolus stellatus SS14]
MSAPYLAAFSTSPFVNLTDISQVPLSDTSLGVTKVSSGTSHPVVAGPITGEASWQATYPNGSYAPSSGIRGGFGFYLAGPNFFADLLPTATEVLTSYSVYFEEDWEWQKGGKLPGQYGGVGDLAYACSGGRQTDRAQCFDLRFMWRTDGLGELYAYLPLTDGNAQILASVPPLTIENPDYGFSVGRGAWTFPAGTWTVIAERVKLNDPEDTNGEVQVWINGTSVINVNGLQLRNSSDSVFGGMHFQTFFGGSTSDYASPQTQNAWFTDISGAIIQ